MPRLVDDTACAAVQSPTPTSCGFVVATDGTPESDGAVRVGFALAQRDGVKADVFSAVQPPLIIGLDGAPIPDVDELVAIACDARGSMLLAQRDRTHPAIHDWPFTVEVGPRVETIVSRASRVGASLILLGLGSHGVGARLSQRETALRVIRASKKPVLALPSDSWGVPHSALAALDFTGTSEHAAKAALDLLGDEGTLYVAHVKPRLTIPQGDSRTWDEITSDTVIRQLHATIRRLGPPPSVRIEYVLLHGDPAHELLAFAEQMRIDLVAAGMHGRSALGRLMMGSVSTALVRSASCMVLVAPPAS